MKYRVRRSPPEPPPRIHTKFDFAARELPGILNQVAKSTQNFRPARDHRFGGTPRRPYPDHRRARIGLFNVGTNQRREVQRFEGLAAPIRGLGGDVGENFTALLRLAQQQRDILGDRIVDGDLAGKLIRDHGDRGQRRTQLMCRGRRQTVQCRELLRARQGGLGLGQCFRHPAGFFRHRPDIGRNEDRRDGERRPNAQEIYQRQLECIGCPGERQVVIGQPGGHRDRETGQGDRGTPRQDRRRHQNGCQNQDREGIGQSAGEKKQGRELHEIEPEQESRVAVGETHPARIAKREQHVRQRQHRNGGNTPGERQGIPQTEMHREDGDKLPRRRNPADEHKGSKTERNARRLSGIPHVAHATRRARAGRRRKTRANGLPRMSE